MLHTADFLGSLVPWFWAQEKTSPTFSWGPWVTVCSGQQLLPPPELGTLVTRQSTSSARQACWWPSLACLPCGCLAICSGSLHWPLRARQSFTLDTHGPKEHNDQASWWVSFCSAFSCKRGGSIFYLRILFSWCLNLGSGVNKHVTWKWGVFFFVSYSDTFYIFSYLITLVLSTGQK